MDDTLLPISKRRNTGGWRRTILLCTALSCVAGCVIVVLVTSGTAENPSNTDALSKSPHSMVATGHPIGDGESDVGERVGQLETQVAELLKHVAQLQAEVDKLKPAPPCDLKCEHNSKPNSDCTRCNCEGGWTGTICNECADCQHGGKLSDKDKCLCSGCAGSWTGHHCETCPLVDQCKHDGVPDENCSACVCVPGWTGDTCEEYSGGGGSVDGVISHLKELQAASEKEAEALAKDEFPPLPGAIGTGLDSSTGALRLPVVQLSYNGASGRTWTSKSGKTYSIPTEAMYEDVPGLHQPLTESNMWASISEYREERNNYAAKRAARAGLLALADRLKEVFESRFSPDKSLGVVMQLHTISEMSLPVGEGNKREYKLHHLAARAVSCLPPVYDDETKKAYRLFIESWGTHYTTSSALGGAVQFESAMEDCLSDTMDRDAKAAQVSGDFKTMLGLGEGINLDERYVAHRSTRLSFIGGDPEKGEASWKDWVGTVEMNPAQLRYTYSTIAELVEDTTVRGNLQRAISEFVEEMVAQDDAAMEEILRAARAAFMGEQPVGAVYTRGVCTDDNRYPGRYPARHTVGQMSLAAGARGEVDLQDPYEMSVEHKSFSVYLRVYCERDATSGMLRAVLGSGTGSLNHGKQEVESGLGWPEEAGPWADRGQCTEKQTHKSYHWWTGDGNMEVDFGVKCCFCTMVEDPVSHEAKCVPRC